MAIDQSALDVIALSRDEYQLIVDKLGREPASSVMLSGTDALSRQMSASRRHLGWGQTPERSSSCPYVDRKAVVLAPKPWP